jgi:ammonia channel protein AmtB
MLWFSFFAFNTGSAKSVIATPYIIPLIGINTSMSGALAGISCTAIYYVLNRRKYS